MAHLRDADHERESGRGGGNWGVVSPTGGTGEDKACVPLVPMLSSVEFDANEAKFHVENGSTMNKKEVCLTVICLRLISNRHDRII